MTKWQDFEKECVQDLSKKYGQYVKFSLCGGSNAKSSDITVKTRNNKIFNMEVKKCPAQCGQFVLLPNMTEQIFDYSSKNATKKTPDVNRIIKHMNDNFDEYKNAGKKGKEIIFDNCDVVFANWVKNYYKEKKVKYFITCNCIILPVEKFSNYFKITATYRIKKSGSQNVSKKNLQSVINYLSSEFNIISSRNDSNKLFVTLSSKHSDMDKKKFEVKKDVYMFSKKEKEYLIRKLSKTHNGNVIFSISLKKTKQDKNDLSDFKKNLK